MNPSHRPATAGELTESGWRPKSVRDEIRQNLVARLRTGRPLFPGVHGYERTVVPALVNALLARHDLILLGLRGQAKTRLLRALADLLDEAIPAVEGCEINDDPLAPACTRCLARAAVEKGALPIRWMEREERYREKLATPDVTIADLIGDIDPIKAANLRKTFADPDVIHFGIIPRTNRGIFAINELPDLAPRIQVGLLNILEERDLQIRGFPVRIPLDVLMVFSANPEDYTNRGNIITPLKDRISSQILTHYPADVATARKITDQEAWSERPGGIVAELPEPVLDLVERVAFAARESELVDQSSGVSARMTIALREILLSNMERRALATGEPQVAARLCDFWATLPAVTGKVEMVYEGEQQGAELVAKKILGTAMKGLFLEVFPAPAKERPRPRPDSEESDEIDFGPRRMKKAEPPPGRKSEPTPYDAILAFFAGGGEVTFSDEAPRADHEARLDSVPGLRELVAARLPGRPPAELSFFAELVLEGLHQHLRIARGDLDSTITYAEALRFDLLTRPRS